jgi:hypothetical protein
MNSDAISNEPTRVSLFPFTHHDPGMQIPPVSVLAEIKNTTVDGMALSEITCTDYWRIVGV